MRREPFWRGITKAELERTIRQIVNGQPFDEAFASELIADLIAERHYYCSLVPLRPTEFKKTSANKPYAFYGRFGRGWHKVSWRKCLWAPRLDEVITDALRIRVASLVAGYQRAHPACERCGLTASEEVHHAEPAFKDILSKALAQASDDDKRKALASWDWWKTEDFVLADDLPLTRLFDRLHGAARLEALCKPCHHKAKARRTDGTECA